MGRDETELANRTLATASLDDIENIFGSECCVVNVKEEGTLDG
jgi:hypothetical protein